MANPPRKNNIAHLSIKNARTVAEPGLKHTEVPGFEMTHQGLYRKAPSKDGSEIIPKKICDSFEVLAQSRDIDNRGWGLLLRWRDLDGVEHKWIMSRGLLAGEAAEVRQRLSDGGLYVSPRHADRGALAEFLAQQQPPKRVRTVPQVGWYLPTKGATFVLPRETIGQVAEEEVMLESVAPGPSVYREAGTLDGWQAKVSARCIGNRLLVFSVSMALAGPLLTPLGEPGGGVHLYGQSRRGKSTALGVAASVWGPPSGHVSFARNWRATGNALESTAADHNDCLLPLDEIKQVEAKELGEIAYMLGNGSGKIRSTRDGKTRSPLTWRLLFLSTGEMKMLDVIAEAGQRAAAGQEIRLVDVPADAGAGHGLFQDLHGENHPGAFAEALKSATQANHGVAGRQLLLWLQPKLAEKPTWAHETLAHRIDDFVAEFVPTGSDGQVRSVGRRFAVIALGGELATEAGITAWPKGTAWAASGECFKAWLQERGDHGAREDMEAIERIRRTIAVSGAARFDPIRSKQTDPTEVPTAQDAPHEGGPIRANRLGWRKWLPNAESPGGGSWAYLFTPAGFREVLAGASIGDAAAALHKAGHLRAGPAHWSRTERIPGISKPVPVYWINDSILGEERSGQSGDADGD